MPHQHTNSLFFVLFAFFILIMTSLYNFKTIIDLSFENSILRTNILLLNLTCNKDNNNKCLNEDPIIFVTPTSYRPEQKADLTRLGQTLGNICNLFWIIVEDAQLPSKFIDDLFNRLKIKGVHLVKQTPADKKLKFSDPRWKFPRGVEQRNSALFWIRNNLNSWKRGIVYFGDDDNTYDWRLFDEMRKINQKIGVWPVGIVGGMLVETPLLDRTLTNYTVNGFNSLWKPERPFPMDMAGFAINISLIHEHSTSLFSYKSPRGFMESRFLQSLDIKREELEPLAMHCTKVFVWHTRTQKSALMADEFQKFNMAINISSSLSTVEEDAIF
uniref:Galactosylgalactosylxylosylprotein 3-beta-glucuronosyltransferase n=1 Tax=Meloidogyne incognita TaxID=6306 RepID=A0A914N2T0_MELIC